MSYISQNTSSWQNTFCPSDWPMHSNDVRAQASPTSSKDEDYLSFVELTKAHVEQRSLFHFPNQRHLANERQHTFTPSNCNHKMLVFPVFQHCFSNTWLQTSQEVWGLVRNIIILKSKRV